MLIYCLLYLSSGIKKSTVVWFEKSLSDTSWYDLKCNKNICSDRTTGEPDFLLVLFAQISLLDCLALTDSCYSQWLTYYIHTV